MVSLSSVITYQDVLCAVKFNSNNKSAENVVRSGDRPKYPCCITTAKDGVITISLCMGPTPSSVMLCEIGSSWSASFQLTKHGTKRIDFGQLESPCQLTAELGMAMQ